MLAHHALACCTVACARVVTRSALVPAPRRESTCWFAEHAIVNAVLVVLTAPALAACAADPVGCAAHGAERAWATSAYPSCLALWLHAYHVALYSLTPDDVLHHVAFAAMLGVPAWVFPWGSACNALLFFMCGLPGGSIYALLAARRCGALLWVDEPVYSALWNVVVRCPGILFCVGVLGLGVWSGSGPGAPAWAICTQVSLSSVNAVYYANQSARRAWKKREYKLAD